MIMDQLGRREAEDSPLVRRTCREGRIRPELRSSDADPRLEEPVAALKFEDVYRTHFRLVWRNLVRFGVREADLMDVTQNVFMVVHRKLSGFESRAPLTTWLFTVCRLAAKDYLLSARIRREVVVDVNEFPWPGANAKTQLEHVDSQEVLRWFDSILQRLPEKIRAVFVLFALEEMSGNEIASFLEIPIGTVRSRLRLARARIGSDVARFFEIPHPV